MDVHGDITQAELHAKCGDRFALFEQLVSVTAQALGVPGYALLAALPQDKDKLGFAIAAGGMNEALVKLCADAMSRLGKSLAQRLEEAEGKTGLPS